MYYPVLAERVRYFKENVKGATTMCREVEKIAMAERNEGRTEGYIESSARAVRNVMAKISLSIEEAMQFLELPDSEKDAVRKLIEQ